MGTNFISQATQPVQHQIQLKSRTEGLTLKNIGWTSPPDFTINNSFTTAQVKGIRYERKVGDVLITLCAELGFELISHKWIKYGRFFAQPDFVLVSPSGAVILIEVKYTYTDTLEQRKLYTQLLSALGYKTITSFTVCHNLTTQTPRDKIIHDFFSLAQDSIWQLRI